MIDRKFKIAIATFSYGGNGGIASEHPDVRNWILETVPKMKEHDSIHSVRLFDQADTPITMCRNNAVQWARAVEADVLFMLDSDQAPDKYQDSPFANPFFDSTFDFFLKHYDRGPCVVGAPYCGPPPCENIYVFEWHNWESSSKNPCDTQLVAYSRSEAARMTGIQPCAALPTGLIMWDMRCFELVEPPYFYYEYKDKFETEKASTEDVTATRDISLAGCIKLGYNPVYCNWSSWAGHWKPKLVGPPVMIATDDVAEKMQVAVQDSLRRDTRVMWVGAGEGNGSGNVELRGNGKFREYTPPGNPRRTQSVQSRDLILKMVNEVCFSRTPGDIVELGCFKGDTSIQIAELLQANKSDKKFWVYDTFSGLPEATKEDGELKPYLNAGVLFSDRQIFEDRFTSTDVPLPEIVQGVFGKDDLPMPDSVAFLLIDFDRYEGILAALEAFYDRVSDRGWILIDDYDVVDMPGVKQAVCEFMSQPGRNEGVVDFAEERMAGILRYHMVPLPGKRGTVVAGA